MTVLFENETEQEFDDEMIELIERAIEKTADIEGVPYEFEVSVTITDNESIRAINKQYRGIDKATDVLSFPLLAIETPGDVEGVDDEDAFNMDTGELMLGDIILSYEKAVEQADSYNHRLRREVGFLTVHSMLHLLGYDHMTNEDEAIMISKQENVLEELSLKR